MGLLAVVERERCLLACVRNGGWHSIRPLSVAPATGEKLRLVIEREAVLQGFDISGPIYVHAVNEGELIGGLGLPNVIWSEGGEYDAPVLAQPSEA